MNTKKLLFASILLMNIFISAVSNCQWISQNLPLKGGLMICLKFTDNNHGTIGGWFFNINGDIQANGYYTNDGGAAWNESSINDSIRSLVEMEFISEQTGFAVGAYNPTGTSKKVKNYFPDLSLYDYYFSTGIAIGDQDYKAVVMKTTDGGASWFSFGNIPDSLSYLESIEIADSQNVYISTIRQVGNDFYPGIYKTDINFQHWEKFYLPFDSGDVRKIICLDNFIIGTGFKENNNSASIGVVVSSYDHGLTWSLYEFPAISYFNDLRFLNENTGFISGIDNGNNPIPNSSIFRTTNKGLNWIKLPVVLDSFFVFGLETVRNSGVLYLYANKFSGKGYPSESVGTFIGRSVNAGDTWTIQPVLNKYSMLFNCQALNSHDAYCVGAYSSIGIGKLIIDPIVIKTTNGGSVFISSQNHELPLSFSLSQNYPNPFNPVTNLKFGIPAFPQGGPESGLVSLKVFDLLGKEVAILVNETLPPGNYEMKFNASNLTSGIYFYELRVNNYRDVKRMVLLK